MKTKFGLSFLGKQKREEEERRKEEEEEEEEEEMYGCYDDFVWIVWMAMILYGKVWIFGLWYGD